MHQLAAEVISSVYLSAKKSTHAHPRRRWSSGQLRVPALFFTGWQFGSEGETEWRMWLSQQGQTQREVCDDTETQTRLRAVGTRGKMDCGGLNNNVREAASQRWKKPPKKLPGDTNIITEGLGGELLYPSLRPPPYPTPHGGSWDLYAETPLFFFVHVWIWMRGERVEKTELWEKKKKWAPRQAEKYSWKRRTWLEKDETGGGQLVPLIQLRLFMLANVINYSRGRWFSL